MLATSHFKGRIPYHAKRADPPNNGTVSTAMVEVKVQDVDCKHTCVSTQTLDNTCSTWDDWITHQLVEAVDLYDDSSREKPSESSSLFTGGYLPEVHVNAAKWVQAS